MNEEQRRALIDSLEQAFASYGMDLYQGARYFCRYLDGKRALLEASRSRETLDAYLQSTQAFNETEAAMAAAFFSAAPLLVNDAVLDAIREKAATLSSVPGRPVKLTPEMKREVVAQILRLLATGLDMGAAQLRVSQQFGISKRSVQSVWRKRRELAEHPFQSIRDLWKFTEST